MPRKPTYEEMERRLEALDKKAVNCKRTEEALRESEQLLRAIIESTADGILMVNKNGQVIFTNERFVQMWRIPDEIIKKREDNILLDFVLDRFLCWNNLPKTGRSPRIGNLDILSSSLV